MLVIFDITFCDFTPLSVTTKVLLPLYTHSRSLHWLSCMRLSARGTASDFTSHSPSAPQTFPRQFSGYSAVHTHSKSAHGRSLTRLFTCYSNKFHSVFMEMQLIIQGRPLNKGSCNCRNTCIVCTRYCTTLYSYSDVLTLELSSQAGQSPQSPGDRHTNTQDG